MLFNRTTFNNLAETERLTLKFIKCQLRIRRPIDWLVMPFLIIYLQDANALEYVIHHKDVPLSHYQL